MLKIISLGVGIQSTALYYMSSMGEIERCDHAIFADTGGEKTDTLLYWEYLLKWQKENNGIKLHRANYFDLQNDLIQKQLKTEDRNVFASIPAFTINKDGQKGMLHRQCTSWYKIKQVNKKIRDILELRKHQRFPKIEVMIGITLDEMEGMSIPQDKWRINVYPFCGYKTFSDGTCKKIDTTTMTRNDIINWYTKHNLKTPGKSSCKFCPFQSDSGWLKMKKEYPKDFKDAIMIDEAFRNSSDKNTAYIHKSMKPLKDVIFDETQTTIWGNCTDACEI